MPCFSKKGYTVDMSLGPTASAQEVKETPLTRTRVITSQVLKNVSEHPAERIFYFGMGLLVIGLPLGIHFPSIYYGVLGVLGIILICQFALKERDKNRDHANK